MQVIKQSMSQFLEGSGKIFVIPVSQRDYAWTVSECDKLREDILMLHKT